MSRFLSKNAKRWEAPKLKKNCFDISTTHPLTTNLGRIVPVFCEPVSPNSALHINPTFGFDSLPFATQMQGHIKANLAYFYVRTRTLWDNWQKFTMQNPIHPTAYAHPYIAQNNWTGCGTLADHFGIPCTKYGSSAEPISQTIHGFGGANGSNINEYGQQMQADDFTRTQNALNASFGNNGASSTGGYYRGVDWLKSNNESPFEAPYAGVCTYNWDNSPALDNPTLKYLIEGRNEAKFARSFVSGSKVRYGNYWIMEQPIKQVMPTANNGITVYWLNSCIDGIVSTTSRANFLTVGLYAGTDWEHATALLSLTNPTRGTASYSQDVWPHPFDQSMADYEKVRATIDPYRFYFTDKEVEKCNEVLSNGMQLWVVVFNHIKEASTDTYRIMYSNRDYYTKPAIPYITYLNNGQSAGSSSGSNTPLGTQTGHNVSFYVQGLIPHYTPEGEQKTHELASYCGGVVNCSYKCSDSVIEVGGESPFDGEDPACHINALPFRAYEAIYNSHFRPRLLDPFRKDGEIAIDDFVTNHADGADATTPTTFKYALFADDYFTSCLNTPMGNDYHEMLAGITADEATLGNVTEIGFTGGVEGEERNFKIKLHLDDDNEHVSAIDSYTTNTDKFTLDVLKEGIKYGITKRAIVMADALNKWFEASYRGGRYSYSDFINAHFGHHATHYIQNKPEYLGGFTEHMTMNETTNTNAEVNGTSNSVPLGYVANKGTWSKSKGKPIECYADEEGFVIGVLWFSVDAINNQSIRKFWMRSDVSDYPTPELANLGVMEVRQKEINPLQCTWGDHGNANDTFGYQRNYGDLLTAFDYASGRFRKDMSNYMFQRVWNMPTLSREFVEMHAENLNNPYAEADTTKDKIFGYVHHDAQRMIWLNQTPNIMIM